MHGRPCQRDEICLPDELVFCPPLHSIISLSACFVLFFVSVYSGIIVQVTTDVKTAHGVVGDVGGDMKFGLRSPFGYGESVSLQHVKGLAGAADWSLGLNVPNLKGIYGYCTGESLAAAEIAAAASAAGVGASSAAIPASLPPASTASSMATSKTTALTPSILESCAASLKPLRNHALHSFALGSLSFNVSSTIENSFNRNSLLYKNLGVVSTWRSTTGRNTVSFECMKREEEPPAPYGDGSIGLMSGLGASTFAGMNVGPEAGKPPLMTTTGDVASQVQHGLDLLQYSVGRRRNVPYVSDVISLLRIISCFFLFTSSLSNSSLSIIYSTLLLFHTL